jgi:uncharacterized MAPEG superfamily protein
MNAWEALTAYLAITWIAHEAGANDRTLTTLGIAWVISRLAYYAAYVAGFGRTRILLWALGVALIVARFVVAVRT